MSLFSQVVQLVLTPALIVAGLAWLMRSFFDQSLRRDLAKFQNELEASRFEHQTRFSLIHQRQAEVISGLYSRLAKARRLIAQLVALFQPGGQNLAEKKQRAADACNDADEFFNENRLYLAEDLAAKVEDSLDIMKGAFITFETAMQANEYEPDHSGLWKQANDELKEKLPPLQTEMEARFRSILGVIEGEHSY